jgi:hypothetical protein
MDAVDISHKAVVVAEEKVVDMLEALLVRQERTMKGKNHRGEPQGCRRRLVATVMFWLGLELAKLGLASGHCTRICCFLSELAKQVLCDDPC